MRNDRLKVMAACLVGLFVLAIPARADTDLSGRWNSDSLRDNDVGYYLVVTPGSANTSSFSGSLRFRFQDGRKGRATPVRLRVRGTAVTIDARGGSFDKSPGVLRGILDPRRMTLTLTNCQDRLTLVMANDLDSDCVLRLVPVDR